MNVTLELVGRSPLVMHNSRLANPDEEIVRQIKAITDKRKKTEQDRKDITKLEWFGGLILGINGHSQEPAIGTSSIRKCLINAGKISKQGTQVARALAFSDMFVPLVYDGPRDPEQLWEMPEFRYHTSVVIGQSRTMRMRPQFPKWSAVVTGYLMEDVLDLNDFQRIAERGGLAVGIGDNRANGYGRFEVKVVGE